MMLGNIGSSSGYSLYVSHLLRITAVSVAYSQEKAVRVLASAAQLLDQECCRTPANVADLKQTTYYASLRQACYFVLWARPSESCRRQQALQA